MLWCDGHSWVFGVSAAGNFRYAVRVQAFLQSRAATTESQGNLTYFAYFPWLPIEAALSIFNVSFFVKINSFFEKDLMKTKETVISAADCHQCRRLSSVPPNLTLFINVCVV
jgi:hypothetical protein